MMRKKRKGKKSRTRHKERNSGDLPCQVAGVQIQDHLACLDPGEMARCSPWSIDGDTDGAKLIRSGGSNAKKLRMLHLPSAVTSERPLIAIN